MKLNYNEDPGEVFKSKKANYKGQTTRRLKFLGHSAASVGPFILLGKKIKNDESGQVVLQHEHGHYLDYRELGFFRYFIGIGLPSIINAKRKPVKRLIVGYYNQPWEAHADVRAGVSRTEHTPEALVLCEAYYKYIASIKGKKWFKFLFKDIWKFIAHDFTALEK